MTKKICLLYLILTLLIVPIQALAQSDAALASVLVELWPEYDRPTMLVIYHIVLSNEVPLPYKMELRIPKEAGDPHAVAVSQPDGSLNSIPYETIQETGWSRITLQATTNEIQLEYYDPRLQKEDGKRKFAYVWPGDFSVDALSLDVQKPIKAENMQIIPGMASPEQRSDGLTYYHTNVGPLSKGQSFEIKVQYEKSDDSLSYEDLPVAPSAPLDETSTGAISITSVLPWVLGIIGLTLIIGGGVWYWRSGHRKELPTKKANKRRSSAPASNETEAKYCHQCGKRAAQGDRFCRICGAPLK